MLWNPRGRCEQAVRQRQRGVTTQSPADSALEHGVASADLTILIVVGVLLACGVFLLLERVVSKMLLGTILLSNGVNLLLSSAGGASGRPPILGSPGTAPQQPADPLAQGLILTAIVITLGITAFVLALAYRTYFLTTSEQVENDPEDVGIARHPVPEDPER